MGVRLSVIVLAWNQEELTRRCVASLRANTDVDYELIIVDNGSEPGARSFAADSADVPVLHSENLGFSRGMNSGLEQASGDFVAFVNNDTTMPGGWASTLLEDFARFPNAGIVLPAVTAAGNRVSVRDQPGSRVMPLRRFIDLPGGVVYMMNTRVVRELGGWDERYEVASREDLDLLFTVWCNGLEVVLDERVLVDHESSATANSQLQDKDEIWQRNWEVFVSKWTAASPDEIARLDSTPSETFSHDLEAAAVAAHWMSRWYEAWNQERSLRRELREIEKTPARPQEPARPGIRDRVLTMLRLESRDRS